nr:RecName: Full=ATP synthase subunit beta, mitochondrial [Pinus pinaster]
ESIASFQGVLDGKYD